MFRHNSHDLRCRLCSLCIVSFLSFSFDLCYGSSSVEVHRPVLKPQPLKIDGVPASLSRVVQLASTLTAPSQKDKKDDEKMDRLSQKPTGKVAERWQSWTGSSQQQDIHDNFDPSVPSLWEQVSGGSVSSACGSVSGEALCFKEPGSRFATTSHINTIAGGVVRFSLRMSFEEGMPADVVLEYKSIGKGWTVIETYSEQTYDIPSYSNPNGQSIAVWDGGSTDGFTLYSVSLPAGARSAASKLRWRQARAQVSGELAPWALDDVSIEPDPSPRPAVSVSAPASTGAAALGGAGGGGGSALLTAVLTFSQPVTPLMPDHLVVHNGTVASLTRFPTKIMGVGDLYTCLVRPTGTDAKYAITVQLPEGACRNGQGQPNLASNVFTLNVGEKPKIPSRLGLAFGPRPGPADTREAETQMSGDGQGLRPLRPGESHPTKGLDGSTSFTDVFQSAESIQRKLTEAQAIYKRLSAQSSPAPPAAMMKKLEEEIATLKAGTSSLKQAEQLAIHRTNMPQLGHNHSAHESAEHQEIHQDMDELRKERAETYQMMEAARKMRDEMIRVKEELMKEQEAQAQAAKEQQAQVQHQQDLQVQALSAAVREAVRDEHDKLTAESHHGHDHHDRHDHRDHHAHHDHHDHYDHGDHHDLHDHRRHVHQHDSHYSHDHHAHELDPHRHTTTTGISDFHAESVLDHGHHLEAQQSASGLLDPEEMEEEDHFGGGHGHAHGHGHPHEHHAVDEMDSMHHDLHAEMDSIAAQHREIEQDLKEQRDILTTKQLLREELTIERQELVREREDLEQVRQSLLELEEVKRRERETWAEEQRRFMDEMTVKHRQLNEQAQILQKERAAIQSAEGHSSEEHAGLSPASASHAHEHAHSQHSRSHSHSRHEDEMTEERKLRDELLAARQELLAEKERIAEAARRELKEEKERLQKQHEIENAARQMWADEQRKFMEELMAQQRALREEATWIKNEHKMHHWSEDNDAHGKLHENKSGLNSNDHSREVDTQGIPANLDTLNGIGT